MSLFDYLNSDSSSTSSTSSIASLLQQVAAQRGVSVSSETLDALGGDTSATSSSTSSVQISVSAQQASADAADAKKDAATLASEIRSTLDTQYGGKKNQTPNMNAFSGRALSIVALNQDGSFSKAEVAAAKSQLRERDRQSAVTFLNSGDLTAASLKSYTQQLLAARAGMSAEEQQLRDSDPDLR